MLIVKIDVERGELTGLAMVMEVLGREEMDLQVLPAVRMRGP